MKCKGKRLKVASFSDVHLGHARVPAYEIIGRLKHTFPDNGETGKLDLIVIAGDFFDKLVFLPSDVTYDVQTYIVGFLRLCVKRNIVLRVMEGTPSHDRGQPKHFEYLNAEYDIGCNVRYVDKLSVEHCEALDISILYIPDEWDTNPDNTWKQAQEAVRGAGLKQVDIALTHGYFDYQVPEHLNFTHHKSERYLSLVRGYIFHGHVHEMSVCERILSNGSFDRLNHGEEHAKGHWRVELSPCFNDNRAAFHENKHATPHRTLVLSGWSLEDALEEIERVCEELRPVIKDRKNRAFLRIQAESGARIFSSMLELNGRHKGIVWSTKTDKDKGMKLETQESVIGEKFKTTEITPANVTHMVEGALKDRDIPSHVRERVSVNLKQLITG